MRIGRMLAPVSVLGPGLRVAIWTQGCRFGCSGCMSPELQPERGIDLPEPMVAEYVIQAADRANCTGLTISGGEPLLQPEQLLAFLRLVRNRFPDILLYTGYRRDEIPPALHEALFRNVDVIIDGRYIEAENSPECILRGSGNQQINFTTPALEERYFEYMRRGRQREYVLNGGRVICVGIKDRVGEKGCKC